MPDDFKRASWIELFYDVAYISLVAQLTYLAAKHHHSLIDIFNIVIIGYAIFHAWWITTANRNLQSTETASDKLLIQIQMVGAFVMSLSMAGVFDGHYMPFFLTLGGVRFLQTALFVWMLYSTPSIRPVTYNILQGFTIASVLWVVSAFVPSPVHYIVILAALLVDVLTPQTRGKGNTTRYLNVHHLQERLGLFLMLVIGESMIVVALSNSVSVFSFSQLSIVFSGLGLMVALWWLYFEHNDDHVGVRPKNLFLFLQAHGVLYGSIISTSVAYKLLLEEKGDSNAITFLLLGAFGISVSLIIIRSTLHKICNRSVLLISGLLLIGALIAFRGWEVDRVHETVITITLVFILTATLDYFSFFKETREG